jgi:5,10-methylenetetrahydrofolate reductase
LGAAAIGIETLLCVSGDHTTAGDHKAAKPVYDLDSVQTLSMLEDMQNGKDCGGNPLDQSPSFFKGAAVSATATPFGPQLMKTRKKIAAGAGFLITLPVFTLEQIAQFFEAASELTTPILAGVLLPSYQEITEYRAGVIPGTPIPKDLVGAWKELDEDAFRSASVDHTRDLITKLRDSGKFAGICISASNREADIQELLA